MYIHSLTLEAFELKSATPQISMQSTFENVPGNIVENFLQLK